MTTITTTIEAFNAAISRNARPDPRQDPRYEEAVANGYHVYGWVWTRKMTPTDFMEFCEEGKRKQAAEKAKRDADRARWAKLS